ncbi:MAG: hypothetical protein M3548_04320 [Actinomycetota bacterium]|nr:hypothetical protein [Actinomycetota bacterium]
MPVPAALAGLFPWTGLRRGSTVAVRDIGLLLALLAEPTARGSWGAVVGVPSLGVVAAAEIGVDPGRLALVPRPGNDVVGVVAALLDGFDIVAVAVAKMGDAQARRLSARARNRGAVLMPIGPWPGADIELRCARTRWSGLGVGHGQLSAREVDIHARGRGAAARPTRTTVTLQSDQTRSPTATRDASSSSRAMVASSKGSVRPPATV